MNNKTEWKKQIEEKKPNEGEIKKSEQKKQGRESRKERIKNKKLKYDEMVKEEKKKRKFWKENEGDIKDE